MRASAATATVVTILTATSLGATGWLDYTLDIGAGFAVYRMNSFEVCLGGTDRSLLICPSDFPGQVGPLLDYAVADSVVATRHSGVRPDPRNPSLPAADETIEWFFLVDRTSRQPLGPFSRADFDRHRLRPSQLNWQQPHNPNFWRPVLGTLYFLGMSAVILGWPLAIVGVLFLFAGLAWWRIRRGHRAAA